MLTLQSQTLLRLCYQHARSSAELIEAHGRGSHSTVMGIFLCSLAALRRVQLVQIECYWRRAFPRCRLPAGVVLSLEAGQEEDLLRRRLLIGHIRRLHAGMKLALERLLDDAEGEVLKSLVGELLYWERRIGVMVKVDSLPVGLQQERAGFWSSREAKIRRVQKGTEGANSPVASPSAYPYAVPGRIGRRLGRGLRWRAW